MKQPATHSSFTRAAKAALSFALVCGVICAASASPVPQNLGNGLNKIVENNLLQQNAIQPPALGGNPTKAQVNDYVAKYKADTQKVAAAFDKMAIKENGSGRYLVDIMPGGDVPLATLRKNLEAAFPSLKIVNTDSKYAGHGALEGYIAVADAAKLAKTTGVRSVILQLRPIHNVGAVTSQGVNQHRVNRINQSYNANATLNVDGTGMSVGVMSDSYNSQPSEEGGFTTAQQDVASGDLPGNAATSGNAQPVVVLEDYNPTPGATNEGRGMCQIVADMAPKARIGFATADVGEIGFANNIRALAALPGFTKDPTIQQGFKGDVVCDDVSYIDEPMFQDGIVAQGVIDVVNAGVTYCSSAANNWGTDGYSSVFRPVANAPASLVGTNIKLTGVPAALYTGGFHNFNPNGLDIAQTINTSSDPQFAIFQWDDAYDTTTPTLGPIVYGPVTGDSEGGAAVDYVVTLNAGQEYVVTENATHQTQTEDFDAIIAIIDPNGRTLLDQDTGVDETVTFFAPIAGNYTIHVHPFSNNQGGIDVPTQGHFTLKVNTANGTPRITQDFNLLFFDMSGNFIEAIASPNFANNRPYELWQPDFSNNYSQVQLVIARSNATAPANAASHMKYVFFGNGASGIGPAEYNDYLTPVTYGHSAVAGANSVAAYAMFRPNLPEDFTSPGPVAIYFDTANNRLATPEVRLKPDIAAADGANNTFFPLGPANDYPFDPDSFPNFYGTSAASPHAAAIAALVLQAHKPTVLTPAQVKTIMQLNTFPHDLDPYFSGGSASAPNGGTVTVSISSDNDSNTGTGSNDHNSWTVNYTGAGFLKSLAFNPQGTAQTGGNPTGGNFNGFTPMDFMNPLLYKYTPGMVFNSNQFVQGTSDVTGTATFKNPAPPPSTNAFNWTLNVAFGSDFTTGKTYHFNVGRAQQQDATTPQGQTIPDPVFGQPNTYSADILGDGVLIPEHGDNPVTLPGMTFSAVIADGTTDYPVTGRIANNVGRGYSPLDGYGFINAENAVSASIPVRTVVSRRVHGTAGTFDVALPISGTIGTECRTPGTNGSYQLVYTFTNTLSAPGTAAVTQGTATAATPVLGPAANQVTVNLTGVTNVQHLVVTLSNAKDGASTVLTPFTARMDVLFGDTNKDKQVDGADISQTKAQSGAKVTTSNFREDVNADGAIDAGDIALTKNASGTGF
jgi:hypothetical protein